ncbi:MAG: nickel pincer cofactor biosynthesis protein LarB [Chloroflexota bacterium]
MTQPFDDLFEALSALQGPEETRREASQRSRPDFRREQRKGVPEVILAEGKPLGDVLEIVASFVEGTGRALVSRVSPELLELLRRTYADHSVEIYGGGRTVVVRSRGSVVAKSGGKVGIMTAGTSDIPVADEARVVAQEMGCEVLTAFDVGVAGIHRVFQPLKAMLEAPVDSIVVAAGMDGALPSVVAGLVDVPVIGLPTSTGYGLGGRGVTALLSMLQTCSPGLVVVNIDNGVGAGATAALIANRMARARRSTEGVG